jgi:hypothetical protein
MLIKQHWTKTGITVELTKATSSEALDRLAAKGNIQHDWNLLSGQ